MRRSSRSSRSPAQVAEHASHLDLLAGALASSPMTAAEAVEALEGTPAACARVTVYGRVRALATRGERVRREKRDPVPGKRGQRDVVYSIEVKR